MSADGTIDLRSDTVTKPSEAMRRAIASAEVGDDVLDGDPTTNALEQRVAALLGTEAALFFPSGTQANQTALHILGRPATEVLCDSGAHVINYEQAAMAVVSGLQPRPVETARGFPGVQELDRAMRRSKYEPTVSLLILENTHNSRGGTVMRRHELIEASAWARDGGLGIHLDGARLWNAVVAGELPVDGFAPHVDTIMVSFSKVLGCPVGSILAGSSRLMDRAWQVRKMLGGGMRQSGILAAACHEGLEDYEARAAEANAKARRLARGLEDISSLTVGQPETNIVMAEVRNGDAGVLVDRLRQVGILVVPLDRRLRMVTHADVSDEEIGVTIERVRRLLN